MPTDEELKSFYAAFDQWRSDTEDYDIFMRELINGAPLDQAILDSLTKRLSKSHAAFMTASKPFVHYGR